MKQNKLSNEKQKVVLLDIDYTIFDTAIHKESNLEKYVLYDEVVSVLVRLGEVAELGIFSEGELTHQKKKLIKTEVKHYFDERHVHIVTSKNDVIKELLEKYEGKKDLFLVDDKLTILHKAKTYTPSVFTIWVKRGIYAMNQQPIKGFTPDVTVENLAEIIPYIIK